MITIKIKTENDAFAGCNKWSEVGRILEKISKHCVDFEPTRNYLDSNGNTVCTVTESK